MFRKFSGTFMVVAVLAATSIAAAEPTSFAIRSVTTGNFLEDFTIDSYDWGSTDFIDVTPNDGVAQFYNIAVNSGASTRPGFDYEITFNYLAYSIIDFGAGTHSLDILNIKPQGTNEPITNVVAKNLTGAPIGLVSTDGSSIFFDASNADILAGGEFVTIQFSQIPEPGTMGMLLLGGLALIRRKR